MMNRCTSWLWAPAGPATVRHRRGHPGQIAFVVMSVLVTLLAGVCGEGAGPVALHLAASSWLSGVTALMVLDALRPRPAPPRALVWSAWSMAPVVVVVQIGSFGTDLLRWDLLWSPASVGMVAGWSLVKGTPGRLRRTLRRLADREVLIGGTDVVDELSRELDRIARRWACGIGAGTVAAFVATGPWAGFGFGAIRGPGIWLGPFGLAYLVPIILGVAVLGAWSGRLAAYGRLGAVVARRGIRLRAVPDHPDGAGGLRPVGAYFLHQSFFAALSPIYIIAWLVVLAVTGGDGIASRYRSFASQFWWLLPLAVLFEILAFLVPVQSIHTMMRRQKETTLWTESDRLSRRIEELRGRLERTAVEGQRCGDEAEKAQLDLLVRRFEMLEGAPTWPIDASIRKRFTLRNLALLLPVAGYAFGNPGFWEKLADVFIDFR
jgi:hypothetical protein